MGVGGEDEDEEEEEGDAGLGWAWQRVSSPPYAAGSPLYAAGAHVELYRGLVYGPGGPLNTAMCVAGVAAAECARGMRGHANGAWSAQQDEDYCTRHGTPS